ncbi:MAG TPA: peptidase S41, partial [Porphyromonadaceae bacterium]|nr:peptidase S41 [Porphyromonadaceae bacterium]
NPVYFNKVIDWGGRKVGYLVYNHFSSGKTDNDKSFDKDMLARFKDFKTAGVNEFVLDLRYNNGGSLSCAQLLSTMLAPQSALGKTMCTLEYNDKQRPQNINIALNSSLIADGANL